MTTETKKFVGCQTLAKAVNRSARTIERALRANKITADGIFVTPRGRRLAMFDESRIENLTQLFN